MRQPAAGFSPVVLAYFSAFSARMAAVCNNGRAYAAPLSASTIRATWRPILTE